MTPGIISGPGKVAGLENQAAERDAVVEDQRPHLTKAHADGLHDGLIFAGERVADAVAQVKAAHNVLRLGGD